VLFPGSRPAWKYLCDRATLAGVSASNQSFAQPASRAPAATDAPEPSAEDALADELLAGIGALRRGLRRCAGPDWPFSPLTGAQGELLKLVRRQPGISVAAAAAELRVAANTVSTLVRQLSHQQLLTRDVDPDDRRVARLRITEEAAARFGRWRDGRTHALSAVLPELSPAHRQALADVVPALAELTRRLDGPDGKEGKRE
jgi:DNA-binding MarR family transcriptional regulator